MTPVSTKLLIIITQTINQSRISSYERWKSKVDVDQYLSRLKPYIRVFFWHIDNMAETKNKKRKFWGKTIAYIGSNLFWKFLSSDSILLYHVNTWNAIQPFLQKILCLMANSRMANHGFLKIQILTFPNFQESNHLPILQMLWYSSFSSS